MISDRLPPSIQNQSQGDEPWLFYCPPQAAPPKGGILRGILISLTSFVTFAKIGGDLFGKITFPTKVFGSKSKKDRWPAMNQKKYNLLYSVNTWLAYNISIRHYGGLHFVWCSPVFSARNHPGYQATPPPTSCPSDIYHGLAEEVRRRDGHSAKIAENRQAIIAGAKRKHASGVITADELREIEEIAAAAECADFRPLLYLIPFVGVSHLLKEVPVSKRAHPLSPEYIIEELPTDLFDAIELEKA